MRRIRTTLIYPTVLCEALRLVTLNDFLSIRSKILKLIHKISTVNWGIHLIAYIKMCQRSGQFELAELKTIEFSFSAYRWARGYALACSTFYNQTCSEIGVHFDLVRRVFEFLQSLTMDVVNNTNNPPLQLKDGWHDVESVGLWPHFTGELILHITCNQASQL
jgi:hypothetical protein